jgi:hypothetical protein
MKIVDGCTLTNVDVADVCGKIVTKNDKLFYEYNSTPVIEKLITTNTTKGKLIPKVFKTYLLITVQ